MVQNHGYRQVNQLDSHVITYLVTELASQIIRHFVDWLVSQHIVKVYTVKQPGQMMWEP